MKIEAQSNSPAELQDKVGAVCCCNKNTVEELRAYLAGLRTSLLNIVDSTCGDETKRNASVFANTIAKGVDMARSNKYTEPLELAKLVVFAGQIKIGYL